MLWTEYRVRNWTRQKLRKTLSALKNGTVVAVLGVSALTAGCNGVKTWAPELTPPERPELLAISPEEWAAIPPSVRETLTENQIRIYRYVAQLELIIDRYGAWRTGDKGAEP